MYPHLRSRRVFPRSTIRLQGWGRRSGDDPIAPIRFCLVQRTVGRTDQFGQGTSVGGVGCDADGHGDDTEVLSAVSDGQAADTEAAVMS